MQMTWRVCAFWEEEHMVWWKKSGISERVQSLQLRYVITHFDSTIDTQLIIYMYKHSNDCSYYKVISFSENHSHTKSGGDKKVAHGFRYLFKVIGLSIYSSFLRCHVSRRWRDDSYGGDGYIPRQILYEGQEHQQIDSRRNTRKNCILGNLSISYNM